MVFLRDPNTYPDNVELRWPWTVVDFISTNGISAVQWDGGPAYSIHGRSTRRLPILYLDNLYAIPDWGRLLSLSRSSLTDTARNLRSRLTSA